MEAVGGAASWTRRALTAAAAGGEGVEEGAVLMEGEEEEETRWTTDSTSSAAASCGRWKSRMRPMNPSFPPKSRSTGGRRRLWTLSCPARSSRPWAVMSCEAGRGCGTRLPSPRPQARAGRGR